MSHYLDGGSGRTLIAINHRLADAILGGQGQQFAMIDLKEARALKSDAARFIHQRLCGWINLGSIAKVSLDTLCSYVWVDEKNTTEVLGSTRSMRKRRGECLGPSVINY